MRSDKEALCGETRQDSLVLVLRMRNQWRPSGACVRGGGGGKGIHDGTPPVPFAVHRGVAAHAVQSPGHGGLPTRMPLGMHFEVLGSGKAPNVCLISYQDYRMLCFSC